MENQKAILNELEGIKKSLASLKEHIEDITLTREDVEAIKESEKELEVGETTSLEELKKENNL